MALKIRLRQQGRTNRAFYRLVVTDSRSPRDGKYVEALVGIIRSKKLKTTRNCRSKLTVFSTG